MTKLHRSILQLLVVDQLVVLPRINDNSYIIDGDSSLCDSRSKDELVSFGLIESLPLLFGQDLAMQGIDLKAILIEKALIVLSELGDFINTMAED